jgi:hypothetical protein
MLRLSRLAKLIPALFGFGLGAMIQIPGPREAEKNACVWVGSIFPGVAENCFHGWIIYLVATALLVGGIVWFLWPEQSRAKIKITGPFLSPDQLGHDRWRFRVTNRGPATANNVQMRLTEISPRPRYGRWQADYPYQVERVGKTFRDLPARINPGDTEDFEFKTWQGSDGNIYASLDTKDTPPHYSLLSNLMKNGNCATR